MRKPILASLLLLFCMVAVASGQGTTSRVTGTVHDANGGAVAGAMVTLTNEATGVSFNTTTSDSGTYS
ncbi:MAG TPA: carboxypeptidase-like regulatory domain-containing protein, partial [Pyrinomonadaceae bacterium]|nr:carboxypeptidase-like regulatory domain-containing protein [Pyrinomonadaceae bacterium]